jgi:hypothetical protein
MLQRGQRPATLNDIAIINQKLNDNRIYGRFIIT